MDHETYDNAYISGILNDVRTIAIVGASANDVSKRLDLAVRLLLGDGEARS